MAPNEEVHEVTRPAEGPVVDDEQDESRDADPTEAADTDPVGEDQAARNRADEPPA